ncbi:hypothetical protein QPX51_09915, partial [Corynebacterium pseudodiphtheriticum]|uniref:hypothetical protein n=1 Tax=Corynebacterium pseudodiphtheriticum TaxID=37637 RepID=UPI002541179B
MNHQVPMNKAVRRKGVTIAAAALSVALVAPFAQSVAYPEISAAARAQENNSGEVKKLDKNPPTFYANQQAGLETNRKQGARTVRSTGILAGTFFPQGTKFELQDPQWTFNRGATGVGGNLGWYGFSRSDGNDPKSLNYGNVGTQLVQPLGNENHPYVVENTGQILFGLSNAANGKKRSVPLRARWTDPNTGRQHVWLFEQEIQVGPSLAQSANDCKPGQKFVNPTNQRELFQFGNTMSRATTTFVAETSNLDNTHLLQTQQVTNETKELRGNGENRAEIRVSGLNSDGTVKWTETTNAGPAGNWRLSIPDNRLTENTIVSVTQLKDGVESLPVRVTVGDAKAPVVPPSVNPVTVKTGTDASEGAKISGRGKVPAPVTVQVAGYDKLFTTKVQPNGEWSLTLPADIKLAAGQEIRVTQEHGGVILADEKAPVAQNFGLYPQRMGDVGECIAKEYIPKEFVSQPSESLGYPEELVKIASSDTGDQRTKTSAEPSLPSPLQKRDGDVFRFPKDLPEGLVPLVGDNTQLIFNGETPDDPSDDIYLSIDPATGSVTVTGGANADTKGPRDVPVEFVSADGALKGHDTVSIQVEPESDTPAPSISGTPADGGNVIPEGEATKIG